MLLFVNSYTNECKFKMYVDANGCYRKPHRMAVRVGRDKYLVWL